MEHFGGPKRTKSGCRAKSERCPEATASGLWVQSAEGRGGRTPAGCGPAEPRRSGRCGLSSAGRAQGAPRALLVGRVLLEPEERQCWDRTPIRRTQGLLP